MNEPVELGVSPGRRLAGFARVDSRVDTRVQVADLLANAERPVALFGTQERTCRAHDAIDELKARGATEVFERERSLGGELLDAFTELNRRQEEKDDRLFANPRNAAASR